MFKVSAIRNSIAQKYRDKRAVKHGIKVIKSKSGIYTVHQSRGSKGDAVFMTYKNNIPYKKIVQTRLGPEVAVNSSDGESLSGLKNNKKRELIYFHDTSVTNLVTNAETKIISSIRSAFDESSTPNKLRVTSRKIFTMKQTPEDIFITAKLTEAENGKVTFHKVFDKENTKLSVDEANRLLSFRSEDFSQLYLLQLDKLQNSIKSAKKEIFTIFGDYC